MRERLMIGLLVGILIIIFGIMLAVLGKGEYAPPPPEGGQIQITELVRHL